MRYLHMLHVSKGTRIDYPKNNLHIFYSIVRDPHLNISLSEFGKYYKFYLSIDSFCFVPSEVPACKLFSIYQSNVISTN